MLIYLLKSAACMAIFLLFYKLLLEKENMHIFKRSYLMLALVASFVIPSLVFVEYVEPALTTYNNTTTFVQTSTPIVTETPARDIDVINWYLIAWSVYSVGVAVFGVRFLRNLFQILNRIRRNPKLKERFSIKVLLLEQLPPHTFFKYIFLNKEKFEASSIPKEVLLHEEIHAKQRHSIDVLFVEFLQVILWFNPLIFFFKKCIKLNHEFLADSAVIKKTISPSNYQNTLLSYLSQDSLEKYQSVKMANAINYSSIKKRFKVMKTHTSKKAVLLRSILVLPLLALLLFAFSTTKEVIKPTSIANSINLDHTARSIEITILKDGSYLVDGIKANRVNLVEIVNTLHQDISSETRRKIINIHVKSAEEVAREEVWFLYNSLMDYGFHRLVTDEQVVNLSKGNTPYAIENERSTANSIQKKNIQKGASREQMKTYNSLAKKYNEMSRDDMRISMKDVEQLKYIYSIMSDKQKADAEPFPDFPEPPPAPKAINSPNAPLPSSESPKVVNGQATTIPQPPSPKVIKGQVNAIPAPPSPPTPPSPLDHVIDMAKKGATFYFEGKKISSDKAIELIKKNKNLNISTKKSSSKNPQVRISKEPIKIGKATKKGNELLEYAMELEKRNANFYIDNKYIDSKKALSIIAKKVYNRVETFPYKSKTPEVRIYTKPLAQKKSSGINLETGNIKVNGKELFYSTKNGVTSYFNKEGEQVDRQGILLSKEQKKNPTFYFNGEKITSSKAHQLLNNNKSIQVTTEDYTEDEYAIVLADLSKVSYQNRNKNNNPNSVIDLTEMIEKEASFFYNDEPISVEKALWLTKNDNIERVQTIGTKNGKPKVYFWTKA
ncbi:M56 family metallopeptidase [uncultured Croceitalea sp.]|uniref:M56 family metallopeptidase n=1 Tax=uncultured Croceitalea sp. TaxID=1798908 RepID=UPI0033065896